MRAETVIFLPNWVGDFLMAFASLDRVFKEGMLFFGKPHFFQLIRGKYPGDVWIEKKSAFLRDLATLFKSRATCAVLLPNSFGSALLATLSGMSKVVGVPSDFRGFLLTKRVLPSATHQAEIYRELLEAAGLSFEGELEARMYLAREDLEWAREKLDALGVRGEPVFAFHPGASKALRRWPADRFAEVARRVAKRGWFVVAVGDRRDAALVDTPSAGFYNLAAESPPLGRLAAFLSLCSLFLGNDSGPLHIAAAAGVPCVGIYGTSVPERTAPVLRRGGVFKAVASRLPCSPCRERLKRECEPVDGVPRCIHGIGVEEVWGALEPLL